MADAEEVLPPPPAPAVPEAIPDPVVEAVDPAIPAAQAAEQEVIFWFCLWVCIPRLVRSIALLGVRRVLFRRL